MDIDQMKKTLILEGVEVQNGLLNVYSKALSDAFEAGRQSLAEQLQKELMNLPVDKSLAEGDLVSPNYAYRVGHRDARHAAVNKVLQLVANT